VATSQAAARNIGRDCIHPKAAVGGLFVVLSSFVVGCAFTRGSTPHKGAHFSSSRMTTVIAPLLLIPDMPHANRITPGGFQGPR
jgi:hypothetical protein